MKSTQIRGLIEKGIVVVVTRKDGVVERYDKTKDGKIAISHTGAHVCKYCGAKRQASVVSCSCDHQFELISLTGAFRHINSIAQRLRLNTYDSNTRKLYLNEREGLAC